AFATVALLMVSSCASWTPEQEEYTAIGADGGALVGGGVGCAIGLQSDEDDPKTVGLGMRIGCADRCPRRRRGWLPASPEAGTAASATSSTAASSTPTASTAAGQAEAGAARSALRFQQ